ncbi:hypothetical protein CL1_0173 [Thermococcus cleftensis]|uniref:DUF2079 domain-containing protein n=1 Tax=Thermococcus cleftensis (strain DSM 27260 / KACC 17922 / CL1) TaxID=163003 RepID=I3ZRQ4_THECF|nr:DUF2079 domain-containing protein [Thermococcus cleftensis]AFL94388.1 hypothetical protein CL1_0173 [Thermococcus cleftensis]
MQKRRSSYFLWVTMVTYSAAMVLISFNRHYTFRTNAFDMGIFMQSLWSTVHGDFMYNTVEWFVFCAPNHFRIHLSPVLAVLAPLYGLLPHAETLLVIQTVVISLSAYLLYLLAGRIIGESKIALALVVMYLGNSLVQGINSYDFHAVPFAMPFIFLAALMIEQKRYGLALLSALGILSAREDAGIAVISLGLFYLLKNREIFSPSTYVSIIRALKSGTLDELERTSLVFIAVGTAWILLGWVVVDSSHLASFYGGLLDGCNIPMKAVYFLVASATLGMLTFLKPKYSLLLTALPWAEILLSCEKNLYRVGFQYPYMLVPLSMIAIMYALAEMPGNRRSRTVVMALALGLFVSTVTSPVLPGENGLTGILEIPANYYVPVTGHDRMLMDVTRALAATDFSVLTQNDIFPHLANRENTYVIWASYCGRALPRADLVLLDWTLSYADYNFLVEDLLSEYTVIYKRDGVEIWVRNDLIGTREVENLQRVLEGIQ